MSDTVSGVIQNGFRIKPCSAIKIVMAEKNGTPFLDYIDIQIRPRGAVTRLRPQVGDNGLVRLDEIPQFVFDEADSPHRPGNEVSNVHGQVGPFPKVKFRGPLSGRSKC